MNDIQITSAELPVMEAFYTIQGEGCFTGHAAWFIRLAGCDVGCVWCDVKESWEVAPEQWKSILDLVSDAVLNPARTVVITGGEPYMYDLTELMKLLIENGFKVHTETSGAYPISGDANWVCVSPKKFKFPTDESLQKADELKVVIAHKSDFEWAEQNAAKVNPQCKLLLQPEYNKATAMMPLIVDYIKQHPQWQISLQTHKILGIP